MAAFFTLNEEGLGSNPNGSTMEDYTSIHLSFKFLCGDFDDFAKLPKNPDDIWKKDGKRYKEDGFSYNLVLKGCRLINEQELHPFLGEIEQLLPQMAGIIPDETTTELSIAIYVKDNSGIHIDWHSIAHLEAFGASVDIDIFSVI